MLCPPLEGVQGEEKINLLQKKKSRPASESSSEEESASSNEEYNKAARGFQKENEYPLINWENLSDPGVQRALIIYNDRINTWRRMKDIDAEIDNEPTKKLIAGLAELRIRNLQAFRELESFNNTGEFLNKHPLVTQFSMREQLKKLLRDDPETFLEEYANTRENVKRYRSFLNNPNRSSDQKKLDEINLKKHSEKLHLMKEIHSGNNIENINETEE